VRYLEDFDEEAEEDLEEELEDLVGEEVLDGEPRPARLLPVPRARAGVAQVEVALHKVALLLPHLLSCVVLRFVGGGGVVWWCVVRIALAE
jgi:hypothetical protein